jgi:uncharacterized protein (TIGR02300 family)
MAIGKPCRAGGGAGRFAATVDLEDARVAQAELGQKRVCTSCAAKFYDLNKDPIICPKCGTVFDAAAAAKPRRVRAVAEEKPVKKKAPKLAEVADADLPEADDDAVVEDDEEEEGVIEDASELGEDDDDMAEVIENNVDEDSER